MCFNGNLLARTVGRDNGNIEILWADCLTVSDQFEYQYNLYLYTQFQFYV